MSGWWFSDSASCPTRLTNASASEKSPNSNVRSSAPSPSLQPAGAATGAVCRASTIGRRMVVCPEPEERVGPTTPIPPRVATGTRRRARGELVTDTVYAPLGRLLVRVLLLLRVPPVAVVVANGVAGLGAAVAVVRGDLLAG